MYKKLKFLVVALLFMYLITGCVILEGDMITTEESIERKAEKAEVDIKMGAGLLLISGDSKNLLDAEFSYINEEWEPIIDYTEGTDKDILVIRQPVFLSFNPSGDAYDWDLNFNNEIEMDLKIKLGAGKCQANLGGLNISTLDFSLGAGEAIVDLVGDWKQNLNAYISGGVGSGTIILPKDIGVSVSVKGVIGAVDINGLKKNGNVYVNDAFGQTTNTLHITVEAGVGLIELRVGK